MSQTFYATIELLVGKWGSILSERRVEFMRERAGLYSSRIAEAGAFLDKCVGFVHGTTLFVSRPGGGLQRVCYRGHKRRHGLVFEAVFDPDARPRAGRQQYCSKIRIIIGGRRPRVTITEKPCR